MKKIIIVILILIVGYWIANKAYTKLYINAEKKPFWKGTEQVQVCKQPYYSSDDCYKMLVTLLDDKTAKINFPNGGYKVTEDLTCYFAYRAIKNQPRYVF
jgi:hypothetical protein